LLALLCAGQAWLARSRAHFEAHSCYKNETSLPPQKNSPYNITFTDKSCDDAFLHFRTVEINLESRSPPHKRKRILAYEPADDFDSRQIPLMARWASPDDLHIDIGDVSQIISRLNQVGDINIHYAIGKIAHPGSRDQGSTDHWEWLELGWQAAP
jgi:hypothetical protein